MTFTQYLKLFLDFRTIAKNCAISFRVWLQKIFASNVAFEKSFLPRLWFELELKLNVDGLQSCRWFLGRLPWHRIGGDGEWLQCFIPSEWDDCRWPASSGKGALARQDLLTSFSPIQEDGISTLLSRNNNKLRSGTWIKLANMARYHLLLLSFFFVPQQFLHERTTSNTPITTICDSKRKRTANSERWLL